MCIRDSPPSCAAPRPRSAGLRRGCGTAPSPPLPAWRRRCSIAGTAWAAGAAALPRWHTIPYGWAAMRTRRGVGLRGRPKSAA
eukprot:455337-Alexandrium_andersonii.AAC.1